MINIIPRICPCYQAQFQPPFEPIHVGSYHCRLDALCFCINATNWGRLHKPVIFPAFPLKNVISAFDDSAFPHTLFTVTLSPSFRTANRPWHSNTEYIVSQGQILSSTTRRARQWPQRVYNGLPPPPPQPPRPRSRIGHLHCEEYL